MLISCLIIVLYSIWCNFVCIFHFRCIIKDISTFHHFVDVSGVFEDLGMHRMFEGSSMQNFKRIGARLKKQKKWKWRLIQRIPRSWKAMPLPFHGHGMMILAFQHFFHSEGIESLSIVLCDFPTSILKRFLSHFEHNFDQDFPKGDFHQLYHQLELWKHLDFRFVSLFEDLTC